eukprot:TRINITY_DN59744_c0_g1_i1.p1 TRINITY_DN59744_c0_g1~~TRINITY_DN59744_c0_g1_i1.p1  ORF type:complete len:331 (+),score=34.97 TRINITY_DN59744_c0_g1_i1:194-1186(+)
MPLGETNTKTQCLFWLPFLLGFASVQASRPRGEFGIVTASRNTLRNVKNGSSLSMDSVQPIEWVHVPKTGSSFGNTLLHIRGACPDIPRDADLKGRGKLPRDLCDIPDAWKCNASVLDLTRFHHFSIDFRAFSASMVRHNVPRVCDGRKPRSGWDAGKGKFMMFVRQPEQRFLSHIQELRLFGEDAWLSPNTSLDELKERLVGCMTKMLTRDTFSCEFDSRHPSDVEVEIAKQRLQTGFSFIGHTDRWNLSICLFNKMFDQECHPLQFENTRPTHSKHSAIYDTTKLKGWQDRFDGEVYSAAITIFEHHLRMYKVDESSCESCYRNAGLI